ncbi:JmjC domain-containing protein [Bdellovibrio sp. HCB117]|uniref:JmjC domain-containing protein n=1 Tax=Bdellovibrio sp. HCB117 TaxID=3394359 RepID=UPI0039B6C00B
MSILEQLLAPMTLSDFSTTHLSREPYAAPEKASFLRNCLSWNTLNEILYTGHKNCWLPLQGKLPIEEELCTGQLTFSQARKGFESGRTVLVRHAEQAHPLFAAVARDFYRLFNEPVDVQLYCTPSGQEGFDWHYDYEDVFVIQSDGEKEFRLRKNTVNPGALIQKPSQLEDLQKETNRAELRCYLKPGDWLYIPAGYWHKALALTDSYHISVGVLRGKEKRPSVGSLHL